MVPNMIWTLVTLKKKYECHCMIAQNIKPKWQINDGRTNFILLNYFSSDFSTV